jgi:hypothetical protein
MYTPFFFMRPILAAVRQLPAVAEGNFALRCGQKKFEMSASTET